MQLYPIVFVSWILKRLHLAYKVDCSTEIVHCKQVYQCTEHCTSIGFGDLFVVLNTLNLVCYLYVVYFLWIVQFAAYKSVTLE